MIPPGASIGSGIQIKNPIWCVDSRLLYMLAYLANRNRLTAINAAQLLIAFVSNLFLFLNMANRVRFTIAQPITIVGWFVN